MMEPLSFGCLPALLTDGDVAVDIGVFVVCNSAFEPGAGLAPMESPKGECSPSPAAPRVTTARSNLNP